MNPKKPEDLSALFNERRKTRDVDISTYNEVEGAILEGALPPQYERLFTSTDIKIQLRTLRSADEGLFKFLKDMTVQPRADVLGRRDSDTARNKAENVEKVIYGYYNGSALRGGAEFGAIKSVLDTFQVRFGDGLLLVHPDYNRKLVFLEAKDPRCFYPPVGWHPWSINPLDGALLIYEMTLAEVKQRYAYDSYGDTIPDIMGRLNNAFRPSYGYAGNYEVDDAQMVKVGAYRSKEAWYLCVLSENDVVLMQSETGDPNHPGVCGVASFKQYRRGPIFEGQIGIEAGLMKVINQQIQNTERINKATTYGPPLLGDREVVGGYNEINYALLQGRSAQFYRSAPDSPNNLTQVMGSLLSLAQMFNYNPESNQGSGDANSGKAINALQAGPRSLVTNVLWSPYEVAFPRIHDDCMAMELNLWPNERKTSYGRNGRQSFEVEYTPSSALEGYLGRVKIEEPRLGGYNAFLEAVQKKDAGMLDLRSTLEKDPDIRDVEQVIRRIDSENNEKFAQAAFEALGGQDPLLAIRASAEIDKHIASGKSRFEAIQAVIESGLLEPPAPPEMPAGDPMAALAALGGGQEMPALPPGGLASARGY